MRHGRYNDAERFLRSETQIEGKLNTTLFDIVLEGYMDVNIDLAFQLVEKMHKLEILSNNRGYKAMVMIYYRQGKHDKGQNLFQKMKELGLVTQITTLNSFVSGRPDDQEKQ